MVTKEVKMAHFQWEFRFGGGGLGLGVWSLSFGGGGLGLGVWSLGLSFVIWEILH